MLSRRKWRRRCVWLAVLALPLCAAGPCVQLIEDALIQGFFDATTPLLIERVQASLNP